jgi:hypothetical protein
MMQVNHFLQLDLNWQGGRRKKRKEEEKEEGRRKKEGQERKIRCR